jgi:superfamily II DNA/RNA helicase
LISLFLNKPDSVASKEPGDNISNSPEIENELKNIESQHILILPNEVTPRPFEIHSVLVSVPITREMQNAMGNNTAVSDTINHNEKKQLAFLSNPKSLYYFNSREKSQVYCTKVETVNMIIEASAPNEKIVIFSSSIDVLNSYFQELDKKGYNSLIYTGNDRGKEADGKLRQFQETNTFKVLLTTTFKSAEGLNLDAANHVIILEFWWNPQRIIQAMGRINRLKQRQNIFIYLLCYNQDGQMYEVEQRYYDTMLRKIDFAKVLNPFQQTLPEIKVFSNEDTFRDEFNDFLEKFRHFKRNPPKPKVVAVKKSNQSTQTEAERIKTGANLAFEALWSDMLQAMFPAQNLNSVDLSGSNN